MADLFSLLVQSGNSLGAHSAALAVAGNNVANANTPGYSRQIANLVANPAVSSLGSGAVGTGVSLSDITQARDQFVERQMPVALGSQAQSQAESDALTALTALNPDLQGGLSTTLGAFYSSLQTWSQNPGDLSLRQSVLGSAQSLATSFNQTASSISAARSGLDSAITGKISEVNAAAQSLANLNIQVEVARSSGGSANDVLDARQQAVDTLASLTGATPYTNAAGDISMALPGGTALVVDGHAGSFSAVPDAANGGLLKLQLTRADGSGPSDWNGSSLGGTLGGMFVARDGALKTAADSVDSLSFDLANSLNTVQQAGFAMDGTAGQALFTVPATSSGAAAQMSVNAALAGNARLLAAAGTTPAASGDNSNVLAMLATQSQVLAGGSNPVSTVQQITTAFGNSSAQATALAAHDGALTSHLQSLRDATSGVSIDEEMINLTKAQKAYEAVSKVIATANAMLETLLSIGT
ncbi:MAG TPA: flagellar hook-associated protein FlgK [Polyangia bacterium]|jgi:flagellar hook-associated protein 1 FlgK